MAFVKDTVELVKEIKKGRGISKEELVLSADKGQGKLIVTMSIFDADSNGKVHGLKPGSNQRIFLLAMVMKMFLFRFLFTSCIKVDDIPESTVNLDLIFERLGFPLPPSEDLKFVSDIKLLLLCLGIHGSTSMHSCPFCEGHRARWGKDKDGVERWIKQGGAGRWIPGEPRTLRRIQEHYERWMQETSGDAKKLKYGCLMYISPPIGRISYYL